MKANEAGLKYVSYTKRQAISLISHLYGEGHVIHFILITKDFACRMMNCYYIADEEKLAQLLENLVFVDNPELNELTFVDANGFSPFSDCVEFIKPGEYRLQILF